MCVCVCEYMCTYMSVREWWLPGEKTKFNGQKRVEDRSAVVLEKSRYPK